MITEKQIEIAQALKDTGLINAVFHSVELVNSVDDNKRYPAYKVGAEQYYVGPGDSSGRFAYVRQNGTITRKEIDRIGSASKLYTLGVPIRVVVFSHNESQNFDSLLQRITKVCFVKDVLMQGIHTDAFALQIAESPIGGYAFDVTTFYMAIDLLASIKLSESMCDEDLCKNYKNPI